MHAVKEKIRENRFIITSLSLHFPDISLLHEIIGNICILCACWMPKMLTAEYKMKQQNSALTFLSRYEEKATTS